jgi:signal transduction histidine kinase
MSHELRTPLNAIIGFSEMIENGYFGPLNNKKQQERMRDINLCGNHLLQLINDILDYTKGEAGKLEIHESEVSIPKIVEEAAKMLREKARRKNIELNVNVAADLSKVLVDERKIKQVFINLISNAVKFTLNGGSVSVDVFINKKGEIEASVTDTGIGIPQDDIPTALSVFGQVRNRHLIEEEGTGLGLPLCKMLSELHGGIFHLESEVGVGTKATFTIPVARIIAKKTAATN